MTRILIDVFILAIIGISAILGWRKGFAGVLFSCFRWIIAIGAAIIGSFPLKNYIVENSSLSTAISDKLKIALLSPVSEFRFFNAAPQQMQQVVKEYEQSKAGAIAQSLTDRLLSVICFLAIVIVLVVVTKLILLAISNKEKKGPVGIFNGVLGFLFGCLRGVFIVLVVLVAVFPLFGFINPEGVGPLAEGIRESQLASLLYDHNPILIPFELF